MFYLFKQTVWYEDVSVSKCILFYKNKVGSIRSIYVLKLPNTVT